MTRVLPTISARLLAALTLAALASTLLAPRAPRLHAGESAIETKAAEAWGKALTFLSTTQDKDGAWGASAGHKVGVTAVVLEAWTHAPAAVREAHKDLEPKFVAAAEYLASRQLPSGAIAPAQEYQNYSTGLSVLALARYDAKKYQPVIAKAVAYLKTGQAREETNYDPERHTSYGGFGYGSTLRTDLSNTWIALDGLRAAGVPKEDPLWGRANRFARSCQNSSEVNPWAEKLDFVGDDGGSMYLPNNSPAGTAEGEGGKAHPKSYGSMTAAMILTYLWSGEKAEAKPVALGTGWLEKNWTVTANPGTKKDGQEGRYYYLRVLAKALQALETETVGETKWRPALIEALVEAQQENGSWINPVDRWTEGDPALVTGYALTALGIAQTPKGSDESAAPEAEAETAGEPGPAEAEDGEAE